MPHLNERQRRLLLAAEARLLGHGGVRAVARVAGVSETTVRAGVLELEEGQEPFPEGRVRRGGGGRKGAAALDAGLVPALLALVEPDERGDPESPLRWTTKSLRHLAGELARQGHPVPAPHGRQLAAGEWLQPAGQRQDAGGGPASGPGCAVPVHQRAGQGPSGSRRAGDQRGHQEAGAAGRAPMGGPGVAARRASRCRWRTTASSSPARMWSRRSRTGSMTSPRNTGWVNVGIDHDTPRSPWSPSAAGGRCAAAGDYPQASRLLITADAGGSNSYRYRRLEEPSWPPWPPRRGWRSRSATSRRARNAVACHLRTFVNWQLWMHDAGYASVDRVS